MAVPIKHGFQERKQQNLTHDQHVKNRGMVIQVQVL